MTAAELEQGNSSEKDVEMVDCDPVCEMNMNIDVVTDGVEKKAKMDVHLSAVVEVIVPEKAVLQGEDVLSEPLPVNTDMPPLELSVPGKRAEQSSSTGRPGTTETERKAEGLHWLLEEQMSGEALDETYAEQLFETEGDAWADTCGGPENVHTFTEQDFPHQIPGVEDAVVMEKLKQLRVALADLKLIKEGKVSQEFLSDPDAFMKAVTDMLPSDSAEDFRAGGWTRSYEVWKEMLWAQRGKRPSVGWLLETIRRGVKWETVPPASQTDMPQHEQKLKRAMRALGRQVGQKEARDRMQQKDPAYCQLPNHPSALEYEKELTEKFGEYLVQGAIREVPDGKTVLVGCSIGAVYQNNKVRPIIDPLITNVHLKYERVQYEQLADVMNYAQKGDWATTTDEKSGYHHMALHPSMWNLLGFKWQGKNYVFTHVPFGVGPACRAYTVAKQELYRIVREVGGVDLTSFIDDTMAVARTEQMALFQLATILRLMFALGFTVSKKKLQLPAQRVQFLGLLVDLLNQKFWVPQEKVEAFQKLAQELQDRAEICDRLLAKVAGKLVSFKLAVGMAPLYAQLLFKAYQGKGSWDQLYDTPQQAVADLAWVAEHLEGWNGKSWVQTRQQVVMVGDYGSNTGYGAFFPKGEMTEIEHSLTKEQIAKIEQHTLSSTQGELLALLYAFQTVMEAKPEILKGKQLHYQSDNQGTVAVMNGMKGCPALLPTVREIWDLAWAADVDVTLTWFPRETQLQQYADHLSKLVDNSSWSLDGNLFSEALAMNPWVVKAGGFTVDVFADNLNCKVQWQGKNRFYSRMWCKGTAAVDGFMQPWGRNSSMGRKEFCYIYGDFGSMGRILRKIKQEQANCVLLYPVWPRYWKTMWAGVPIKQKINLSRLAARRGWGLCSPGPRVEQCRRGKERPAWRLEAAIIIWD